MKSNLATTYGELGQLEKALSMERDIYSGSVKLLGEEHRDTFVSANNCASSLCQLRGFEEAKALFRKTVPVARRVLGESDDLTLKMRWTYAMALYKDPDTTLGDLREAVETLESVVRVWTRVLGKAHPETPKIKSALKDAHKALATRAA